MHWLQMLGLLVSESTNRKCQPLDVQSVTQTCWS